MQYSLGSDWVEVPSAGTVTFAVVGTDGAELADATGIPPLSPRAATVFFYGVSGTGLSAKLLSDAPEALLSYGSKHSGGRQQ